MVNNSIIQLRKEWYALRTEILARPNSLLILARLTNKDFKAIIAARSNPLDPTFRNRLPLTVARFNKADQKKIIANGKGFDFPSYDREYTRRYKSELSEINNVLFKSRISDGQVVSGLFKHVKAPDLHPETVAHQCPFYLTRIGTLPVWVVKGIDQAEANEETTRLISLASQVRGTDIEQYREALRRQKTLVRLPLGNVALLLAGPDQEGTLHCSSPVRPGGEYSALAYATGKEFKLAAQ